MLQCACACLLTLCVSAHNICGTNTHKHTRAQLLDGGAGAGDSLTCCVDDACGTDNTNQMRSSHARNVRPSFSRSVPTTGVLRARARARVSLPKLGPSAPPSVLGVVRASQRSSAQLAVARGTVDTRRQHSHEPHWPPLPLLGPSLSSAVPCAQ